MLEPKSSEIWKAYNKILHYKKNTHGMHLFTCLFSSLYHYLRLVPEFSCQYWHLISKGWIIQAFFKKLISFSSFFTFQVHVKPLKNMPKETSMQLLQNLTIDEKKTDHNWVKQQCRNFYQCTNLYHNKVIAFCSKWWRREEVKVCISFFCKLQQYHLNFNTRNWSDLYVHSTPST